MRNRTTAAAIWIAFLLGVVTIALAGSDAFWSSDQNGRLWSLKSGGEINIESGAALKFAGTAFTASDYALDTDLAAYAALAGADFTGAVTFDECIEVNGLFWCGASSTHPYTCDGSDPLGFYVDTDTSNLCYCNGSTFVPVDGSGTCQDGEDS